MDECCHGFSAGKQLVASCLRYINCRSNPNPYSGISKLQRVGQTRLAKPFHPVSEAISSGRKDIRQ